MEPPQLALLADAAFLVPGPDAADAERRGWRALDCCLSDAWQDVLWENTAPNAPAALVWVRLQVTGLTVLAGYVTARPRDAYFARANNDTLLVFEVANRHPLAWLPPTASYAPLQVRAEVECPQGPRIETGGGR